MAGGIDWFRWHHGSVTDPKFQLVARRAGVRLPDVLAVWAFVLEKASASEERGNFGDLDHEAIDCLFGLDDGKTAAILEQMGARGLVDDDHVSAWEKRQPKREREADSSTDRVREFRQRQKATAEADARHETPRNANETPETPRVEKIREEESNTTPPLPPEGGRTVAGAKRFPEFWASWPKHERKQDKAKCLTKWRRERLDAAADAILADIQTKTQTRKWQDGYIEAPLVYLNGRRWEDGVQPQSADDSGGVAAPWHETRSGIEGVGKELGVGMWDEGREQWFPYRDRVFAAARAAGKPMPVRRLEAVTA